MTAHDTRLADLRRETYARLRPPPKLQLSEWAEANVRLPSSLSAQPGPMHLWPQQREILDAIGDDTTERISILKSARVGATQAMVSALGHFVENDPAPVICLVPSEEDARTLMVSNIEPVFQESPNLRAALAQDGTRDTLLHRRYPGGSLMVLSARTPRNLRARTARVLMADEIDGYELDIRGEGDPVELAIRRTATFGNRKIILASTPLHEDTSRILRAYCQGDQREYRLPCPGCGDLIAVRWNDIRWPEGKPEEARWETPCCGTPVEDREKPALVERGQWHPTKTDGQPGHKSYHLTALTSCLPTTTWPALAQEFLQAKRGGPTTLQTFVNVVLGEGWRGAGDDVADVDFAALQRPLDLERMPEGLAAITGGVDVQQDRIELTTLAWLADGTMIVLSHELVFGSPTDDATWIDLDDLLKRRFKLPSGAVTGYDAVLVDSGNWTDEIYRFTKPRTTRKVIACKGAPGFGRPALTWSTSRNTRLAVLGVDGLKLQIHHRVKGGETLLFSDSLGPDYFDMLRAEYIETRFQAGHPVRRWVKLSGRRNEAFDTLTYGIASRQTLIYDLASRAHALSSPAGPEPSKRAVVSSEWANAKGRK